MSNNAVSPSHETPLRLQNFHITFFAIVLGMAGFSLAVQKVGGQNGTGLLPILETPATVLLYITIALFALVALIYLLKIVKYPSSLRKEFNHPVKINFFPLIAKIFLVLSVAYLDRDMQISFYLWSIGAVLQFIASIAIISIWIRHTHFKIEQMTPGWFIPIVGSLIVPIAGVPHGFIEISWFFFSVGLIFWIALFTIVMYRMFFHAPIPDRLLPTLFILFAPPAIAFIAYVKLAGLMGHDGAGLDAFARILYYFSLFMFILILFKVQILAKINFFLSWWAYSFPLAAKTLATIVMLHMTHSLFYKNLALFELGLLALVIVILIVVTINAIAKGEICVED
ncbi:MAG: SLAC1 anion channel family protein [Prosthecochloris sp.]|uniref:C4-dicarboxylate transporter/malic acid transport protein n=1 Tax=Prosthecochloris aestuarii (strain DSM 271 / SK 413) TaxID=290512 RepID=B4S889_PROA2|nr:MULTISPECIES: SLAC1 anion channel family protein [Prosthecochloris]ACF46276.1 C4-dicarboxylate transporter/malic acid transport protein [Prosthecochloris aestuarii DSM 271]MCW8797329.1 SLAC1 anion channel family protein [Prosthecochloris sp.]RDD30191.1 C4-dicarboxylate ABC transporter [Prosthecochloris sp. ZM]